MSIFSRVRLSCAKLLADAQSQIKISNENLELFALKVSSLLDKFDDKPLVFPLRFDKVDDEINVLTCYALLQFGSGYRKELHTATGFLC
jgi:hypothetical protein